MRIGGALGRIFWNKILSWCVLLQFVPQLLLLFVTIMNVSSYERRLHMEYLKLVRKQRNLNQQKVAMDLNITREALSHYETGRREPSLRMLRAMSEYFNVSIDYLLMGHEFQKR